MTDLAALLAAILDDPADDTVRLAYADRLDERGEPGDADRAQFVRVQCEIATCEVNFEGRVFVPCGMCGIETTWHTFTKRCRGLECRLRRREYMTSRRYCVWEWCCGIPAGSSNTYRRGFVEDIQLPWGWWRQHAGDIQASHPVTRVALTTSPEGELRWSATGAVTANDRLCSLDVGGRDVVKVFDNLLYPEINRWHIARELLAKAWPRITFTRVGYLAESP